MLREGEYRYPKERQTSRSLKAFARRLRANPTGAERLLWEELRLCRLAGHRFRQQCIIDPYIVDFYCPQAKLAVEVDGETHLWKSDSDRERDRFLLERGISVVRVTNDQVRHHMKDVKALIASALSDSLLNGNAELRSLP
jgi:very-short-patch-repair endonuclease